MDYGKNAQLVINALSDKINIGLHHISGIKIAKGDRKELMNMVRIFLHLVSTNGYVCAYIHIYNLTTCIFIYVDL